MSQPTRTLTFVNVLTERSYPQTANKALNTATRELTFPTAFIQFPGITDYLAYSKNLNMDLRTASPNPDLWAPIITKLGPGLRRRRNSMQINLVRSKATLSRIKSRVSLPSEKDESDGPSTFLFLRLPLKVRRRIYKELFRLEIPAYLVAAKVLFDFLPRSSNSLFSGGIRSLTFGSDVNWQPFATHTVRDLLRRCTKVRYIRIETTPSVCVQYDHDGVAGHGSFSLRHKKHIIEQMDLCCLMD
ncbi:hypothetical protein K458DRAFT_407238 [Lentithecium fluviatile CBS 122367]|uniref:Uncharacterized protein n=1 Tax=Lentithecium fluviatile CBS 122367 TaxID=1168545 RepID=A0A6G1IQH9_9PLEO|nr:hypothetical protein K458DRAFT_407238 [Lentithecium fluviatile CBS 122367]